MHKEVFTSICVLLNFGRCSKIALHRTYNIKAVISQFLFHIGSDELFTGALWFIGILMVVMMLMPIASNWGGQKTKNPIVVLLFVAVGSYVFSKIPIMIPFLIKIIPGVFFFVYFGFTFKQRILDFVQNDIYLKKMICGLPLFLLLVLLNKTINVSVPVYNDFFVYLFCALFGTLMTLQISTYRMPRFIEYLGKNSLIVFSLHAIWIFIFTDILNRILGTTYAPMADMPHHYVLIGGVIVILMTALSTMLVLPIYNATLKFLKLK